MSDFLIKNLPNYYRLELSERLATIIEQGRSVNLIGVPAVGKYTYINFFINHFNHFLKPKEKIEFVLVNCRDFSGKTAAAFKNFLAKETYHLLPKNKPENKSVENQLKEISQACEVVIVIRFLDEIDKKIINDLWKFFLIIRQPPYRIRFFFLSNRPLSELTDNQVVKSRLLGAEEYFLPDNWKNFVYKVEAHENHLGFNFDPDDRKKIFKLTGGHGGLIKLVTSYAKEKKLKFQVNDLEEKVAKSNLPSDFQIRCQEILGKFKPAEKAILTKIARNQKVSSIPNLFFKLGLIEKKQIKIFSPILNFFLQSQGNN